MAENRNHDVIIIGGSYSGLAAAMALGRSLRKVLVIDDGKPCNMQTPASHNFLTHDGTPPAEIAKLGRQQVGKYNSVSFLTDLASKAIKTDHGFEVTTVSGEKFKSRKLIFATGVLDLLPGIPGFAACWGISVLHCPYCHGYEISNERTGILGNGDYAFEFSRLISNWTSSLTVFTNGQAFLTTDQLKKLEAHKIGIIETNIDSLQHQDGKLQALMLTDGSQFPLKALYTRPPFKQHCDIPQSLGCLETDDGYIAVDAFQKTSVEGVYCCGDNTTRMRSVANAVAMGTNAGTAVNREMIENDFGKDDDD